MVTVDKTKAAKAKKTTKKSTAGNAKKSKGSTFLKSLPESVEHIEIVQQVASVLEELQHRVLDVKEEASKELKKLMKRYETNYRGLEKKVHSVTFEAKKQAQTSMIHLLQKWHEHKEKLPKPLAKEIEKIIEQIGSKMVSSKKPKKSAAAPAPKKDVAPKKPVKKTSPKTMATKKKPPASAKMNAAPITTPNMSNLS